MRVADALLAIALALVAAAAGAQERERRLPARLTIDADAFEWVDNLAVYTGDVTLSADGLRMQGARLEVRQFEDGNLSARAEGSPAIFNHSGASLESDGNDGPPVSAAARTATYDTRTAIVELSGDARLTRGRDEITGQTIRYNVAERRIQAVGAGEGAQVRIVIEPPQAPPGAAPETAPDTAPERGPTPPERP